MNIEKELLSMLDYSTRGKTYEHLSSREVTEIISKYYFGNYTINQIIKNYGLSSDASEVVGDLPRLFNNIKCKYDASRMYVDIPKKEDIIEIFLFTEKYTCPICNHREIKSCKCINCEEMRNKIISECVGNRLLNKEFKSLTISQKVYLATLLQGLHVNKMRDDFGTYLDFYDVSSPILFDGDQILIQFLENKIIGVSELSDTEAFNFENNMISTFKPTLTKYFLNIKSEDEINDECLFSYLKYPNKSIINSKSEAIKLWHELVTEELIRLFKYELSKHKLIFVETKDHNKIVEYLNSLYQLLKPSQIYYLMWMAARHVDNARTRGSLKKSHVNSMIRFMESIRIKKINKGDIIEEYEYPYMFSVSLVSRVFFDQVMLCPEWFVSKVPPIEVNIGIAIEPKELLFYEDLLKREKQIDNFNILDYSYYYLTSFGVIAFDGMVTWLFSDEKTLYQLYKLYPSDQIGDSKENFYRNIDIPYYIDEPYSTSFLLKIIQTFMEKDIDNHVPEKDSKQILEIEERLIDIL
ncbi:hypothetical protein [Vagococcus fluvialis]|uniref:hypothetical protein n=1 Tax=Vagococcus fluvialis TaxID=2738 RepID=UPI002B2FBEB6|nr:hypothetical protein QDW48_04775 [Vagococcus fluvialis]